MSSDAARVVVTGRAWMGRGIGAIASALKELFDGAEDEVLMTAFSISSPTDKIFPLVTSALGRGVRVTLIVNRLSLQPGGVSKTLSRLAREHRHLVLRDFRSTDDQSDLHAKLVIADRKIALVGSSNLSKRGWLTNHELAVLVRGNAARDAAKAFDRLIADRCCFPV